MKSCRTLLLGLAPVLAGFALGFFQQTVTGTNGTWTLTPSPNPPGGPDSMTVAFTPKKVAGGCSNIRLTQMVTVRGYDALGNLIAGEKGDIYKPGRNPFGHVEGDGVLLRNPDGSVYRENGIAIKGHIDHVRSEGDPFYNGDDSAQDTPSKGDATVPSPTTMNDAPERNFGPETRDEIARIETRFETCAICADTGECLGCVNWSSTATRTPRHSGVVAGHGAATDSACSQDMTSALKQFMRRHAAERNADGLLHYYCPDGDDLKRKLIPRAVERRFLLEGVPEPQFASSIAPDSSGMLARLDIRPLGEGKLGKFEAVVQQAYDHPERAAVKFTWSGDQVKTVSSVAFGVRSTARAEWFSPFVTAQGRFVNDRKGLRYVTLSIRSEKALLKLIKRNGMQADGDVTVTIVDEFGTPQAMAFTGQLGNDPMSALMGDFMRKADLSAKQRFVANYLYMNMAPFAPLKPQPK